MPAPALAPVIPPVIVPITQLNVLGTDAVRLMFGPVPLQIVAVGAFVTSGVGFTVIVIENGLPEHNPVMEVGVIRYCTVPVDELLGLVSTWLIMVPDPALAPVIPPVTIPMVQVKVLGADAVRLMFGPVPLQMVAVGVFVTVGVGLMVTVIVKEAPTHEPVVDAGVTRYCTVPELTLLGLVRI